MSEKHQVVCPPRAPSGELRAWPFSRRCGVPHPTLFQMTLVTSLLATVLGRCGPPPILFFASPTKELNQTEFPTDAILKYTCRPGYIRIRSDQTLTCKLNGQWQYEVFCGKKQCRNPGDLPHGIVEIKTDLSFGSKIEFSCSEGYHLVGPTMSVCEIQDKGVDWSAPFPVCEIIKCKSPPDISNGKHSGGDEDLYTYGSSVTYSCDPSYSLLGSPSVSCTVVNKTAGVWSPSPPTCKKIICRQPTIQYANIVSGFGPIYNFKDSIVFSCQKGSVLRGSSLIRCEADNNWNPSPPVCELNSCIDLPEVPNAYWDGFRRPRKGEVYSPGTVFRYYCHPGYKPATYELTTVTCQSDFKWSPAKGCKKVCCPTPEVKNGRSIDAKYAFTIDCPFSYNDVFRYRCDGEIQSHSATCQSDGTWRPRTPLCAQGCHAPPGITHGHYTAVSPYYSDPSFSYKCDEGYKLVGQDTLSCKDSQWSSEAPKCKAQCLKPKIENGKLSVNKPQYIESENVTIHCDSGFGVKGFQTITCSENRTWYPEVPKCEWEVPESCERVAIGRKLMQCLTSPAEVQMALQLYKLSLEIELLQLQIDKARQSTQGP
ncbi:PREDICTED: C4b-binding protein alpha chain isoform X2 [Chinchilla lanigera]|uniref:Complement component 4 binding protein alpha n=1 Tax=Chinchilla lanigera TaxID=34839 RepID=A0A8C2W798_CHILA|nr:PREDICTED: C4b-binding protein alpha chain isoform X2 [Chinchilla lanigera]